MSIGNLKDNGNKGNNFPYQLSNLQLLQAIVSGVTPPGGLATEATLLQVLAALQNGQEFEQSLVIDLGGVGCPGNCPTYLEVRIFDTVTHTFDPPIYYNAAGAVVVPVGPLQYVNPQFVLENILTQVTAINADLDVALSTRASEASLIAGFAAIVAAFGPLATEATLSTRLSKADFEARINTLGQKTMAASTPVVIASDQAPIPVTVGGTGAQVITSSIVADSLASPVAAGATTIRFKTDLTFAGTINGITRNASSEYIFEAAPGKTLPAVAYTVTAGNLMIDVTQ